MAAMGMASSPSSSASSLMQQHFLKMKTKKKNNNHANRVSFNVSASGTFVSDPYDTLRIHRGASESEVKKAFRRLALQYHPDVCRGDNCTVKFHQINEAYDMVISKLRGEPTVEEMESYYDAGIDEPLRGMNDDWDLWEEWMGWEGAGIRDYSSHINPYI